MPGIPKLSVALATCDHTDTAERRTFRSLTTGALFEAPLGDSLTFAGRQFREPSSQQLHYLVPTTAEILRQTGFVSANAAPLKLLDLLAVAVIYLTQYTQDDDPAGAMASDDVLNRMYDALADVFELDLESSDDTPEDEIDAAAWDAWRFWFNRGSAPEQARNAIELCLKLLEPILTEGSQYVLIPTAQSLLSYLEAAPDMACLSVVVGGASLAGHPLLQRVTPAPSLDALTLFEFQTYATPPGERLVCRIR